ncbi:putative chromosomal passenger protein [Trypanosoma grayi]|uniref:putative chromosomal passenger protein n=1 Tax=Trypanosoma grayi TaxID=71804 RepID=UPI0004F480B6|nr:putative chromosomal passenger protein [Trypanosoma grayi]KEG15392.1 putative chromosomal passenger protein [Trypanosoma grayi]
MLSNGSDFFEGLRTFPRDADELRRHCGRLNYTLQKCYSISPELAELALQPQNSEEFNRYYRQQVMRIVSHFNTAARTQLRVRVDPRLPKGMHLTRSGAPPSKSAKTEKITTDRRAAPVAAAASPQLVKNKAPFTRRKDAGDLSWAPVALTDTNAKNRQQLHVDGQQTPQAASSTMATLLHGGYATTDGKATVSSDDSSILMQSSARKSCREVLFSTPPEFKGFTVPLEASPADSLVSKSPLLF